MDEDGIFLLGGPGQGHVHLRRKKTFTPPKCEKVLRQHPAIEDIAIIGVLDDVWGEVGHAFAIVKQGSTLQAEEVILYSAMGSLPLQMA